MCVYIFNELFLEMTCIEMLFRCYRRTKNPFTSMTYPFPKLSLQTLSIKFKVYFLSTTVIFYDVIIEWLTFHCTLPHFLIYWAQLKSRSFTSTNYFLVNLKILWVETSSVIRRMVIQKVSFFINTTFLICSIQNSGIIKRERF